jgi:transcriptional antiterminator NusG
MESSEGPLESLNGGETVVGNDAEESAAQVFEGAQETGTPESVEVESAEDVPAAESELAEVESAEDVPASEPESVEVEAEPESVAASASESVEVEAEPVSVAASEPESAEVEVEPVSAAASEPESVEVEGEQEEDVAESEPVEVESAEDAPAAEPESVEVEAEAEPVSAAASEPEPVEAEGEQEEDVAESESAEVESESDEEIAVPEEVVERPEGTAWYVVHSYSGYENKVRKNLLQRIESMEMGDQIFDVIVPTEEEVEIKDGHRRIYKKRVFPGYILVEMLLTENSWYVVRNTPGVTGFVGSGNEPTPLRQNEVDKIINRMEVETPTIRVGFREGQTVRITDGPFSDFMGTVDEIFLDRGKVRVLVSMFGRETPIELDFLQVEKL